MTTRARILLVITVYNGRAFVPDAIRSAARIETERHDLDILVLDDHSPEAGWSEELATLCAGLGVRYYCTPRNLGIPRNVNLGLLAAHDGGYSHVIIANSDVLFPANLLNVQIAVCESDPTIASVTASSNNASIYSIPNADPLAFLNDQERVDWLSDTLVGRYGSTAIDVPAGISFCILIPAWAVETVGLMDPVFGRGYCEETDWSLRSKALGYRCTVAPGVFVYHAGKGSNESAGLLRTGASTVDEHEAIVDMRYPMFRSEVSAFMSSGILDELHAGWTLQICRAGARQFGYSVEVGYVGGGSDRGTPTISVNPSTCADDPITVDFLGFSASLEFSGRVEDGDVGELIREFGGGPPTEVNLLDRGPRTQRLLESLGGQSINRPIYPTRV